MYICPILRDATSSAKVRQKGMPKIGVMQKGGYQRVSFGRCTFSPEVWVKVPLPHVILRDIRMQYWADEVGCKWGRKD